MTWATALSNNEVLALISTSASESWIEPRGPSDIDSAISYPNAVLSDLKFNVSSRDFDPSSYDDAFIRYLE